MGLAMGLAMGLEMGLVMVGNRLVMWLEMGLAGSQRWALFGHYFLVELGEHPFGTDLGSHFHHRPSVPQTTPNNPQGGWTWSVAITWVLPSRVYGV